MPVQLEAVFRSLAVRNFRHNAVANAGYVARDTLADGDPEGWRVMVLTNVLGPALLVRAALPALTRSRGRIVFVGSTSGLEHLEGSLYSATKWAVTALAENTRLLVTGDGVGVTLIAPGRGRARLTLTRLSSVHKGRLSDDRRTGMDSYDVIVVGLGGMGSAAAYHLAARGLRVLGLERFDPAHNRGSSHGGSRITRQSYFEDPAYVPLLLRAYELWEALATDSGRDVITLTGGLMLGPPDSLVVAGSRRSAEQWGLPYEILDAGQIRRRFPTLAARDGEVALYEQMAGFVRPEATVAAHLQLATRAGADLRFNDPVEKWEAMSGGAGVRVLTGDGAYTADRAVICPGPWAPRLLSRPGHHVQGGTAGHVLVPADRRSGAVPAGSAPDLHLGRGRRPPVLRVPGDRRPGRRREGHLLPAGEICTPESIDRTVYPQEIAAIADHVADRIPTLPGTYLRAATCMYTTTADENFVIATHPEHPQVTVACGFSGHGFKFVPVVGEILADLAIAGTTTHDIALFDPRRPALASS